MNIKVEPPEKSSIHDKTSGNSKLARWLLSIKTTSGIRNKHFFIIAAIFIVFAYIYYNVLSSYHDLYIILFFYPLIYSSLVFRLRGVIISGILFIGILIPHTVLLLYDPVALSRSLLFAVFAFLISGLCAALLNHLEHQLEAYDHIVFLNEELNRSMERLRSSQQQLLQAAKLGAIGQLAASVAHELNNPLGGVKVYTKLLKKKIETESFEQEDVLTNLGEIESAVDYCSDIIRGLLDFARQSPPLIGPITVSRAIDKVISLVGHQVKMKNIEVVREESPSLPLVMGDFNQVLQVFVNLTVNAVQSMAEGGRLTISSSTDEEQNVAVSFRDNGCGISAENMEKLFTPFFTTKEEVKGVGLGLAVSYGIIERHGGRIEVQSEEGKGSTFTVYLPAYK